MKIAHFVAVVSSAFVASFDSLPDAARTEVFRHMALDAGNSRPASDASVAAFAGIAPEAAELVRRWGSKAGQRLGQAYGRLDSMTAAMTEADAAASHAWLGKLPASQRAAIVGALAGGRR